MRFNNCLLEHGRTKTTPLQYPTAGRRRSTNSNTTYTQRNTTTLGRKSPVSGSNIQAGTRGSLGLTSEPNEPPGPIIPRRNKPRGRRRCIVNIITTANSESNPFVLYAASLAITPANTLTVAAAAVLLTLVSVSWRYLKAMLLTWRRQVISRRVTAWINKRKGTRLAGFSRRGLNKTGGGGRAWWRRLDIGDFVPSEFPDSETFWLSVAVLIAWGVVSRVSTYVRKLWSKNKLE